MSRPHPIARGIRVNQEIGPEATPNSLIMAQGIPVTFSEVLNVSILLFECHHGLTPRRRKWIENFLLYCIVVVQPKRRKVFFRDQKK